MGNEIIYENNEGALEVNFDGELIELVQTYEGQVIGSVSLYKDEFDKLKNFIDSEALASGKYRAVLHGVRNGIENIESIWFHTEDEARKAGESGLELYGGTDYTIEFDEEGI